MQQPLTPITKRNSFIRNVINLITPGSRKQTQEMDMDFLASPIKQKLRSEEQQNIENEPPLKDEIISSTGWINPDLILQKNKRVLQTSTLGTGNEDKDEDISELSDQYSKLFNDRLYSDIIFKVGPQSDVIYAHKVIVGNRSLYFKGVFSKSSMFKGQETLSYPEFSSDIFEQVLKYMYIGKITLKLDTVLEVLSLSEKFNMRSLSALCCDFIQSNLDHDNVCRVLQIISKFNCQRLYTHCLKFIDSNILKVLESKSFLELSEELIIVVISRDELVLKTVQEILVFNAVLNWAKYNSRSDDIAFVSKFADRIIPHVRFPLMPKNDLTNSVESSRFVPQDLLMEAYKNHLVPQQSNHERFTQRLCNSRDSKKSVKSE